MRNLRLFFLLFTSVFFTNSTVLCDIDSYCTGLNTGFSHGYNSGLVDGAFLGAVGGMALLTSIIIIDRYDKQRTKNETIERMTNLHTFIQDILYALKDVGENRKRVEQTILSHWIYHDNAHRNTLDLFADWDDFDNFLHTNGIYNKEIIAKFHEFQQCIYSIVMVFYIKDRFNSLDPRMVLNANKYTLLNIIDELYGYINQQLADANYFPVKLNDDLIRFLQCYNRATVFQG